MQALALIKCFPMALSQSDVLPQISLPFNPIKLACLVGWVYLCLYFVQRVQFSPLVPKNRKSIANLTTLFLGPIFWFMLHVVDVIRKSTESRGGIIEVLKQKMDSIDFSTLAARRGSTISLLDSSGRSIKEIYGHGKGKRKDSHVLNLTEQVIADALEDRASDILIDPRDDSNYTVRFRIDGVLRTVEEFDTGTSQAVINSIKAVASMDISERRRPQDGAFMAKTAGGTVSFRAASAGTVNGEKLSVRVLNPMTGMFKLINIGLSQKQQTILESVVAKPSGMVLMCGPTGSGKTATMYAMLDSIDFFTRNVITVEDPIEYVLSNTSQIEVNPRADITFAKTLRSILRQDPDVICVGEIRDEETAEIALWASQTGHLVLATIHSSCNVSALIRLMDLGITPLLLSSGLEVLVSQRLVRRLCDSCKVTAELTQSQILDFQRRKINYSNIFQAVGCDQCYGTGYFGRTAIFDILVLDEKLKTSIANNKLLATEMRKNGDKKGRSNLQKQGLRRVVSGITSLEELKKSGRINMLFWIGILAGGLFVCLTVKMGFYETWALVFNIVISVYLAIFLRPVIVSIPVVADTPASNTLTMLAVAIASFVILQGITYTFLTGQFSVSFPRVFDILGAGFLGFLAGVLVWSFVALLICVTPACRQHEMEKIGFNSEKFQQTNARYLYGWCNLVNKLSFQSDEVNTEQIVKELLEGKTKLETIKQTKPPQTDAVEGGADEEHRPDSPLPETESID